MDFAAPPSARLCIYIHTSQHTYRAFLCHGELMTIQKLNTGREIRFVRLCRKPYILKAHRFYKAKPGTAARVGHFAALLSSLSVRVSGCILDLCKRLGLESKTPIELAIVNNVPGVIGAICGFIPSIVVSLRCPMDQQLARGAVAGISSYGVRHLVMIGGLKAFARAQRTPHEDSRERPSSWPNAAI